MSGANVGPRTQAGLVLALVFVVGGLVGAVADRAAMPGARVVTSGSRDGPAARRPPRDAAGRERGRERFVQQLTRELNLNPMQVQQIDSITRVREARMDSLFARVHGLVVETRTEIGKVLTPDQQAKLQQLRRQHEGRERAGARDSGAVKDTASGKR